ncbi:hypothetical protein BaRGS_00023000 [Batillaria attramentaria]|uniref:Opine dehydrogenase domain-containing protein n=1 Tax=Batillaria attramentaria TaxID=370345 RepID=A0ABD0KF13_9CAEN
MDDRLTVCICGGGNGAHVLAGLTATHAQTEARVLTLFEKEAADWTASMKDNDFIVTRKNKDGGLVRLKAKPAFVTNDPSKAVLGADVIILCVPAFAHEQYFEAISPFVKRDAAIIGLPGQPGFEFQCFDILKDRARTCAVLNYESLPWACRIAEFGKRVDILGIKDALIGSKVVGRSHLNFDPVTLLQSVLGARPVLELANNYLEIYLMTKGFAHPPLMYAKWKDWDGEPLKDRPLFYQGIDEYAASCLCSVSAEIVATARAIGRLRPDLGMDGVEHLERLLHPMKATDDGRWVPDFNNRYLSEDVPYGLAVTKGLAELAGVATPVTDEVLAWCQEKLGKEFIVGSELKGKDVRDTRAPQAYGYRTLDDLAAIL